LCVAVSNYSGKDHFPDMGTTQCSLGFAHNKYNNAACRFTFTTSYQILHEV
jgi:hypothetical protein